MILDLGVLPLLAVVLGATALLRAAEWALTRRRPRRPGYAEGLDAGIQLGLQQALRVIRGYPKPYITMSQEQGWVRARNELASAVATEIDGDLD